jgi:hypothetical protein
MAEPLEQDTDDMFFSPAMEKVVQDSPVTSEVKDRCILWAEKGLKECTASQWTKGIQYYTRLVELAKLMPVTDGPAGINNPAPDNQTSA